MNINDIWHNNIQDLNVTWIVTEYNTQTTDKVIEEKEWTYFTKKFYQDLT